MGKWLNKFLEKKAQSSTDITDRYNSKHDVSVLSVPSQGVFRKNLGNMPRMRTDNTDRCISEPELSVLSLPSEGPFKKISYPIGLSSILDDYEERIAIAEHDGNQDPFQVHRIAYLDAFISILWALTEDDPHQDWLTQKIQTALATLERQNFPTLN